MSTALIERDPPAAAAESPDSIDTWLAVLVRLLHVAPGQRAAIRDEIEAHLRERVRDLMIAGTPEHDAIRTAISELGEVADLARRFSLASKLRMRRTIMNIAVLGVGAVSIATATIMFNGPQQPPSRLAVFDSPSSATGGRASAVLDDTTVAADFAGNLGDVLNYLAQAAGLDLILDRRALENSGIGLDEEITLHLSQKRPIAQVLDLVAAQLDQPFAWRAADGVLEISTAEVFDRREIVLASFDVQNVLDLIWATGGDEVSATERLETLIIEYVEPNAWQVNGGDLANVSVVGGKMFVKSPARFHEPIQWILGQLEESAAAVAARPPGAASAFGRRGVPSGGMLGGGYSSSTLFGRGAATAPSAGSADGTGGWSPLGDPTRPPSAFDPRGVPGGLPSSIGGGAATPAPPAVEPGAVPGSALPPARLPTGDPLSKPATDPASKPGSEPAPEPVNPGGGEGSGGK